MAKNRLRLVVFTGGPLVPVNRVFFDRLAADPRLDLRGIIVDEHERPHRPLATRVARSLRREGWPWLWFKIVTTLESRVRRTAMWLFERWNPPNHRDESYGQWTARTGIPVHRVADIHAAASVALIESLGPELGVILGGRILNGTVIAIPTHGSLNIHKRRVPEYRGGGPVGYWEILAGESSIGVTIHTATTEVDAGAVLAEIAIPIEPCDTLESLGIRADIAGASLYHDAIAQFAEGRRAGAAQDHARARTYRAPSELAVWRLERRLKRRAARQMPLLKEGTPTTARARVLLQYLLLLPWLLYRRRKYIGERRAPLGIFFYHVIGNRPINHMCLPLEEFVRQVEFLRRYHDVLSLDQAVDRVTSGRSDRLAAAITFDDGYRENEWAIAYLRYYGIPAAFFVSMGHVADGTAFEHDRRRGFDQAHPMLAPEVARLASEGFLVGSHGIYHEDFGTLDAANADRILRESRERVAQVCGRAPEYFSFPKGQRAVNITAETYALAASHYRGVFSAYGGHNFPSLGRRHFVRVPNRTDVLDLAMTMDGYTGFRDCVAGNEWGVRSYALAPYESSMRLSQLRQMGLGELAGRSRQHAFKWLDRVGTVAPRRVSFEVASLDSDRALSAGWLPAGADERQDPRITPGSADACARIVARADRVSAGRFDLLGYRDLSFGEPIDWHLDAVSGRRSPLVHWSRLNPLDAAVVGDSKVVWELNRHQWLVHLGEAYRLSGDERYAAVFADRVRAWMAANPSGMGINWASSLEVALRLMAWCWSLELFRRSKALTPALVAEMSRSIASHATHVEKYLSYYFSPNTHLTGEALGLFYAGAVLDRHARATRWRALATRILVQESERQIHRDGVYFEQSTYYQRYTVEIYLHFLVLAERLGVPVPEAVAARVRAMLDFLLSVRRPDGSLPQIGDSDGGWLLPFELRGADDVRGVFATAAALFQRADYAWAAGGPTLETFWLLGGDGLAAFAALEPAPPGRLPSRVFRAGGYVVMRNGWAPDDHQLILDVGLLGCPHSGGHGHADLLSVQCAAFGEPYLADAGTGSYLADEPWRGFFRSSAAHSTVLVDGIGQAAPAGPFAWRARPCARLREWVSNETYDLADAEHDAYLTLPDPVVHRRRVLFVKPRYWVIVDDLDGRDVHTVDLGFQFAPVDLIADLDPWVRAGGIDERGLAIGAWSEVGLERSIVTGGVDPLRGWHSAEYGRREAAPFVAYSVTARFPIRLISAIVPLDHVSASLPTVRELFACAALLES